MHKFKELFVLQFLFFPPKLYLNFYFVLGNSRLTMLQFQVKRKGLGGTDTCIRSPPDPPPIQAATQHRAGQRFFFLTNFLGEDSAVLCCLQDLGSASGLESNSSAVKVWSPNFWATREFPTRQGLRKAYFTMCDGGRPSLETPPTPVCLCWQLVALGCLSFSY